MSHGPDKISDTDKAYPPLESALFLPQKVKGYVANAIIPISDALGRAMKAHPEYHGLVDEQGNPLHSAVEPKMEEGMPNQQTETARSTPQVSTAQTSIMSIKRHPFPEGTNRGELPFYMREFAAVWDSLSVNKKHLVTAYQSEEKEKKWLLNINGIKILMENERAEKETPGVSIKDVQGLGRQTYFAFGKEGYTPGRRRPNTEEWQKMASTVGGWAILRALLQIPLASYIPRIIDDDWSEMVQFVDKMTCVGTGEAGSAIVFTKDGGEIITNVGINSRMCVRLMSDE